MKGEIINKVEKRNIINIDLTDYAPKQVIIEIDIKDFLFEGFILKEKNFREILENKEWDIYINKTVALFCSSDSIIPLWAYMLITGYLNERNIEICFGNQTDVFDNLFLENIKKINTFEFENNRVIVKGCGDITIHEKIFMEITKKLQPIVKSLMFGEACSSVPVYKKK